MQAVDWDTFKGLLDDIVESENLRKFHASKKVEIANLLNQLKSGDIDDGAFMSQISQLYAMFLAMSGIF